MKNTHNKSHVPPSQLPILYVFPITRISKVRLSQSFAYIWYQATNSLGLIRLPSCNFKMEAMLWKVAHEGMKFNLWTTSQTLPLFYLRRLEVLISFKGTFEFDLNINVTFSCKLEFVCENWNFFFEIRAYLRTTFQQTPISSETPLYENKLRFSNSRLQNKLWFSKTNSNSLNKLRFSSQTQMSL